MYSVTHIYVYIINLLNSFPFWIVVKKWNSALCARHHILVVYWIRRSVCSSHNPNSPPFFCPLLTIGFFFSVCESVRDTDCIPAKAAARDMSGLDGSCLVPRDPSDQGAVHLPV